MKYVIRELPLVNSVAAERSKQYPSQRLRVLIPESNLYSHNENDLSGISLVMPSKIEADSPLRINSVILFSYSIAELIFSEFFLNTRAHQVRDFSIGMSPNLAS